MTDLVYLPQKIPRYISQLYVIWLSDRLFLPNSLKNLDPSCKMDLDFWDCLKGKTYGILSFFQSLLMVNTKWYQPHLINLPDHYYKIFQAYRSKTCPVCSNIPKDPCVCLICGVFLCFRESCCRQQHVYECVQVILYFHLPKTWSV